MGEKGRGACILRDLGAWAGWPVTVSGPLGEGWRGGGLFTPPPAPCGAAPPAGGGVAALRAAVVRNASGTGSSVRDLDRCQRPHACQLAGMAHMARMGQPASAPRRNRRSPHLPGIRQETRIHAHFGVPPGTLPLPLREGRAEGTGEGSHTLRDQYYLKANAPHPDPLPASGERGLKLEYFEKPGTTCPPPAGFHLPRRPVRDARLSPCGRGRAARRG